MSKADDVHLSIPKRTDNGYNPTIMASHPNRSNYLLPPAFRRRPTRQAQPFQLNVKGGAPGSLIA